MEHTYKCFTSCLLLFKTYFLIVFHLYHYYYLYLYCLLFKVVFWNKSNWIECHFKFPSHHDTWEVSWYYQSGEWMLFTHSECCSLTVNVVHSHTEVCHPRCELLTIRLCDVLAEIWLSSLLVSVTYTSSWCIVVTNPSCSRQTHRMTATTTTQSCWWWWQTEIMIIMILFIIQII